MKSKIKKIGLLISLISLGTCLSAQEAKTDSIPSDSTKNKKENIKISFGKTKVIIITDDEDDSTGVCCSDTITIKKKKKQRTNKFAGIDLGVNGYLSPQNSTDLQAEAEFMDVEYGKKSLEVAINIWEQYLPIAKEKFGIMTGLGIKYNNYALDRDVVVVNRDDTTTFFEDPTRKINKNKFKTTALHLPLMLETNIGKDADHSFHLAAGGMLDWVIASKTKQKYDQDGSDYKVKDKNDFNTNPFRVVAVARIGYGDFTLYASYSLTPLFEKDQGPELYPFTVGLSLVSF